MSGPNNAEPFYIWAQEGMAVAGISMNSLNMNNGVSNGSSWNASISQMRRSSSQTSSLEQAIDETDIKVYTQASARQTLFAEDERTTSVIVTTAGEKLTLLANKEIIPSAGVFQSSQLLMVSGVGSEAALKATNSRSQIS